MNTYRFIHAYIWVSVCMYSISVHIIHTQKHSHTYTHHNIRAHTSEKGNNPIQMMLKTSSIKCGQIGKQAYNYIPLHLIRFIQIIYTLKTKIES